MKKIITFLLFTFSVAAYSQEILLEQNVKADTIRPSRGPNLKNFTQGYLGIGFPLYTDEAVNYTKPGLSTSFDFGVRYKRKVSSHFAVGLDFGFNLSAFKIKQDEWKLIPENTPNDKEKYQINTAVGSVFMRINVGRRGNYIGNYLDLGGYGGWNISKKHKTTNENANGEKVKVLTGRLKYVESFSYGLLTRIGVNRYALTARYRLSDIFKSSYAMPELPRLVVGVEVGLFR